MIQRPTPAAVAALAQALFDKATPTVLEAHSAYDQPPRQFCAPAEVGDYAAERAKIARGSAHFAVTYPDMLGRVIQRRITLTGVPGHTHRFSCEGWGVIFIFLDFSDPPQLASFIKANSEQRALAWAPTYPNLGSPSAWDWKAVGRHMRRLQRVWKQALTQST